MLVKMVKINVRTDQKTSYRGEKAVKLIFLLLLDQKTEIQRTTDAALKQIFFVPNSFSD